MATKKKTDCRQYRIGDFARYLGVTAEFLKHYQESGLLDVTQRASGYRYYGFDQSARILLGGLQHGAALVSLPHEFSRVS